jgi:hypothetical protein
LDIRQKTGASASTSIGQFLPPTQGFTDATPGRLMKTGDFGLGTTNPPEYPSDFNQPGIPSGFYGRFSPANGPGGNGWSLLQINRSSVRQAQLALRTSTSSTPLATSIAFRQSLDASAGQWLPWQYIYHSRNTLGTVSEESGVPTGAIIQRGSNANGEFVRFADGTQICWRLYTHDFNSDATQTANYPAAFSGADETRSGGWTGTDTSLPNMHLPYERRLAAYPHSTTVWRVRANFGSPVNQQETYRLWAIGRWFIA